MNFQQLKIIKETVRRDFNLTEVAAVLYTSQPGVSKHIKDLEDELGLEIFIRKGKRFLGLTAAGKELLLVADRILVDAGNMGRIADQFSSREHGRLVVATTHTQARYALPLAVKSFRKQFPKVSLALHQGSPREISAMVLAGEADFAIATEGLELSGIVSFPCYSWHHALIVPVDHPLRSLPHLSLEDIAEYPLITYQEGFTGRYKIDAAFQSAGLSPDIVLSAIDADVIKTYVDIGLGVGIIASVAFHPEHDRTLALVNADHLFEVNTTRLGIRRGHYLRDYAYSFIEGFVPELQEAKVRAALNSHHG